MATDDKKPAPKPGTSELSSQAIALAEQLGRIAGTIEGTAEAWLNQTSLTDQLTRVRDGAAQMLNSLGAGAKALRGRKKPAPAKKPASRRAAGPDLAHAPGKKHRKPAPSKHGLKKSDERIPKLKAAQAARQRRKSYA